MNQVVDKEPHRHHQPHESNRSGRVGRLSPMRQRNSGISPTRAASMRLSPTRMSTGALNHTTINNIRRSISPKRNSATGALPSPTKGTTRATSKRDLSPFRMSVPGGALPTKSKRDLSPFRMSVPGGALPPTDLSPLRSNGMTSTGSLPPVSKGLSPLRANSMRASNRSKGLSPIRATSMRTSRNNNMEFIKMGTTSGGLLEEEEPQQDSNSLKNPLLRGSDPAVPTSASSSFPLTTTRRTGSPETTATTATTASSSKTGHANLELTVEVVQGEDLTTNDRNGIMYGTSTSSNPYVIVSVLNEEGEELLVVGQTAHIKSTVNPIWNSTLMNVIPPGTLKSDDYILQLKLMDHDTMFGVDENCTGIVKIPMHVDKKFKPCAWYEIPKDSAPNAKGRLQVAVQTKLEYAMDSFLTRGRNHQSSSLPMNNLSKEDENNNNKQSSIMGATANMFSMGGNNNTTAKSIMGGGGTSTNNANKNTNFTFTTNFSSNFTGETTGSMMGMMFGRKTTKASHEGNPDDYEDIYEDEPVLNLQLTVHQGDKLVAKDRNAIGRFNTSDPYAIVEVWPRGVPLDGQKNAKDFPKIEIGKTPTVRKNLSPVWNHSMSFNVPVKELNVEEAQLRIRILDNDFGISDDDPMGHLDVYLQPRTALDIVEKWYHVSPTSASRACGRVLLSLTTIHAKQSKLVGRRKKQKQGVKDTSTRLKEALAKSSSTNTNNDDNNPKSEDLYEAVSIDDHKEPAIDLMGGSMPARYSLQDDDDDDAEAAVGSVLLAANRNRGQLPKSRVGRFRKASSESLEKERSQRDRPRRNKDGTRTHERPSRRQSTGALHHGSSKETETRSSGTRRVSKLDDDNSKRRVRRARSHLPKLGTESSTSEDRRRTSAGSAARGKEKEESRRERSDSKKDLVAAGDDGERKRVSRSGRTGGLRSARTTPKEMKDNSTAAESKSSRRAVEDDTTATKDSPSSSPQTASNNDRSARMSKSRMGSSSRRHNMSKSAVTSSSRRMDSASSSSRRLHQSSNRDSRRHLKKKSISSGNLATTVEGGGGESEKQARTSPNGSSNHKRSLKKKHSSDRAISSGGTEKGEHSPRKRNGQTNGRSSSERRISGSGRSSKEKESRPGPTKQRNSKKEDETDLVNAPELKAFDDKNHGEHVTVAF